LKGFASSPLSGAAESCFCPKVNAGLDGFDSAALCTEDAPLKEKLVDFFSSVPAGLVVPPKVEPIASSPSPPEGFAPPKVNPLSPEVVEPPKEKPEVLSAAGGAGAGEAPPNLKPAALPAVVAVGAEEVDDDPKENPELPMLAPAAVPPPPNEKPPDPIDAPSAAALVLDKEVPAGVYPARGVSHDIHCVSVSSSFWTQHVSHLQPFVLKRAPHPLLAIFCPHSHTFSPTSSSLFTVLQTVHVKVFSSLVFFSCCESVASSSLTTSSDSDPVLFSLDSVASKVSILLKHFAD
jgi:hypothetical protein